MTPFLQQLSEGPMNTTPCDERHVSGVKLDRLVAEAIGWPALKCCEFEDTGVSDGEISVYRCKDCGQLELVDQEGGGCCGCLPGFSTDLKAAFAAAEKVGLFGFHLLGNLEVYKRKHERGWILEGFASGSTPALTICAAILKLRKAP